MKADEIRDKARAWGVSLLYHFTPLSNLEGILRHGLLPRDLLDAHGLPYTYTDGWRNDGYLNAVSVSIHGINETMFEVKQTEANCAWAILEIEASVLWTHRCRFCWVNAASSEMVNHRGYIGGPWAFEEMFADRPVGPRDNRSSRSVFQTPANMPTMNDAEAQVLDPITPELIRDITVATPHDQDRAAVAMRRAERSLPIVVYRDAFA